MLKVRGDDADDPTTYLMTFGDGAARYLVKLNILIMEYAAMHFFLMLIVSCLCSLFLQNLFCKRRRQKKAGLGMT